MAFQRTLNNIPVSVDRENIGEVIHPRGAKNILSSGRKHFGPKQAFGELKNVIHNHQNLNTPLKTNDQITKSTPFKFSTKNTNIQSCKKNVQESTKLQIKQKEKEKKIPKKSKKFVKDPVAESDDSLCLWAQKIALTDTELDRIINGNDDEIKIPSVKPTVEPFPHIWKTPKIDIFVPDAFDIDEVIPVHTPTLPDDSFENELFEQMLAF